MSVCLGKSRFQRCINLSQIKKKNKSGRRNAVPRTQCERDARERALATLARMRREKRSLTATVFPQLDVEIDHTSLRY